MRKVVSGAVGALAWCALAACGHERNPYLHGHPTVSGGGSDGGGLYIPPPTPPLPDAGGLCGNDIVPVVIDRPNFYFIVDSSGSMGESMPAGSDTVNGTLLSRYDAARLSIRTLLRAVGHRVSYGAAVFPGSPGEGCSPANEVFSTRPGDIVSYARSGTDGPVLRGLLVELAQFPPDGLTPTALAIRSLHDTLANLSGTTYAFLLTDGAPNCNESVPCTADQCTINIEGLCTQGGNCCDGTSGYDARWCLDADPTVQAVADLAAAGIHTYVIGMPGTDAYAELLSRVAVAGQTARDGATKYYPTSSATELSDTLSQIGLAVALSCDIPLSAAPPNDRLVNVFFDQTLVPFDATDGWTWADASTVRLVGKACTDMKSGAASQVQIVAGCPTITR